jgi:hypothetical protein
VAVGERQRDGHREGHGGVREGLGTADLIMNRGMLLDIGQYAAGKAADRFLAESISFACVLVAALGSVAMLLSGRRWPRTLAVALAVVCLTTLVFFVFYPLVACGVFVDLAVLGVVLWAYWPQGIRPAPRQISPSSLATSP